MVLTKIPTRVIIKKDARYTCCGELVVNSQSDHHESLQNTENYYAAELEALLKLLSRIASHCAGKDDDKHKELKKEAEKFEEQLSVHNGKL